MKDIGSMFPQAGCIGLAAAVLCATAPCGYAVVYWTGGAGPDNNWTNALNWNAGAVPTGADTSYIGSGAPGVATASAVVSEPNAASAHLWIAATTGSTGTVHMTASSFTPNNMILGVSGGNATFIQEAGVVDVTNRLNIGNVAACKGRYELRQGALRHRGTGYPNRFYMVGRAEFVQYPGTTAQFEEIRMDGEGTYGLISVSNASLTVNQATSMGQVGSGSRTVEVANATVQLGTYFSAPAAGPAACTYLQYGGTTTASYVSLGCQPGSSFYGRLDEAGEFRSSYLNVGYGTYGCTGRFYQAAGTLVSNGISSVGVGGGTNSYGRYEMHDASLRSESSIVVGNNASVGEFLQYGGTNSYKQWLFLGQTGGTGTYDLAGGRLASDNAAIHVRRDAASMGILRGWGEVRTGGGEFHNNGQVIADGGGMDHSLIITNILYVFRSSAITNAPGESNGWYARNHGKLMLKDNPIGNTATVSAMWGDVLILSYPTLVNSVYYTFNGLSGSSRTLSGALLASDHGDVPAALGNSLAHVLGVWQFTPVNFTFTSAGLTFRYDYPLLSQQRLAESDLRVFHNAGGAGSPWVKLEGICDPDKKLLTVSGVTSLGYFALGVPRRGTLVRIQ